MMMSRRGYARHRGISEAAVRRAIKDGRITVEPNNKIDAVKADKQWKENSDPVQVAAQKRVSKKKTSSDEPEQDLFSAQGQALPSGADEDDDGIDDDVSEEERKSLHAYRSEKEQYLAKLKKLEFEKLSGDLLPRNQVEKAAFDTAQQLNRAIMNIPARISPQLAAESDPAEVSRIIERELRCALDDLSNDIAPAEIGE